MPDGPPLDVDFVYFDLDDTLLDHRHAERAALGDLRAEIPALATVPVNRMKVEYDHVNRDVWKAYGAGHIDKDTAKSIRFARLFDRLAVRGADPRSAGDRYLELYGRHWRYRDGAREAFLSISGRLSVGIITNGFVEIQRAKLARFAELEQRSRAIVISEEVGHMKPDPELFALAADRVGIPAERILYVGDSLHSDIVGGRTAGWQVAWIDGRADEAPEGTFCFDDWRQLVQRIRPPEGRT